MLLCNSILLGNDNLTTSMNQATITLLPKNDKKNFKNWRPISLLRSNYKILTKILSNRLKTALEHSISIEETCGTPNRSIFSNTLSIISNNGFLSTPFSLSRGVRQGCPLSLLLYVINGEVINLIIKNNDKIVGYPIPNQKETTKLSQYTDDTNLFVLIEQSIIEILNFFEQYNLATGKTINSLKLQ